MSVAFSNPPIVSVALFAGTWWFVIELVVRERDVSILSFQQRVRVSAPVKCVLAAKPGDCVITREAVDDVCTQSSPRIVSS